MIKLGYGQEGVQPPRYFLYSAYPNELPYMK